MGEGLDIYTEIRSKKASLFQHSFINYVPLFGILKGIPKS